MQCPRCGGGFEMAGGGQHARCMRCLTLFTMGPQGPTQVQVQAPGGGQNQEFENMMAQNLGFGPPPAGAGRHNIPDMRVGDMNVRVKINGMSPENYAKDKVSSMIWGWIIGGIIILLLIIGGGVLGVYIWYSAKHTNDPVAPKPAEAATWDGKSTYTCDGNENVSLKGVKATAGVVAGGNCHLTLDNCNITAPIGISSDGNARVTVTGGSITGSTNSIKADGLSQVTVTGATIKGKVAKDGLAKVIGAQ